jgi:hypothetical protein
MIFLDLKRKKPGKKIGASRLNRDAPIFQLFFFNDYLFIHFRFNAYRKINKPEITRFMITETIGTM